MSVLRMTPEQYAAHLARVKAAKPDAVVVDVPVKDKKTGLMIVLDGEEPAPNPTAKERMQALGRLKPGEMNKTEARYAAHLEAMKQRGEIHWYKFEGLKFRLADKTFYTPDFAVMVADGHIELHEVKGYWQDDAKVKIKIAADMYPMRFLAVMVLPHKQGGGWSYEDFSA